MYQDLLAEKVFQVNMGDSVKCYYWARALATLLNHQFREVSCEVYLMINQDVAKK